MTSQPTHRRNVLQRVSQAPRLIFGLLMIALLVFALVIGTTGMAVGATEPPAQEPANANLVSAAVEEPEAEPVAVVEETAEAAEVEPIPLESAPAAPAAPAKATAASETKPATEPKPAKAQQQAAAASTQTQSETEGKPAAEDSAPQAVAEPEVAALRWVVTNSEGVNQADTSFEIQGPGGTDVNDDAQWSNGLVSTIADFTGQENYSGLDQDPAVGVFEVEQLVSDSDSTDTEDIGTDETYRVRPSEAPEGVAVGDDANWQSSTGAVQPQDEIDTYELTAPKVSQETDVEGLLGESGTESLTAPEAGPLALDVVPFAVGGPETGVSVPYVYWNVKDQQGNPVAGTSFQIQGPRNNDRNETNSAWNDNSYTVSDWTGESGYTGLDLDPDPGEFQVRRLSGTVNSPNNVDDQRRYRVQLTQVPLGHEILSPTNSVSIGGNRQSPSIGAWQSRTYDFGAFNVKAPTLLTPTCAAGFVYSIAGNGQLRQVSPSNAVTAFGSPGASGEFNGLGIGADGTQIYSYIRSGQTATVQRFDVTTGQWTSTGKSVTAGSGQTISGWVAGGVDLLSGDYYFGGFGTKSINNSNWTVFHVWKYDLVSDAISYSGYAQVINSTGGLSNGDLAFNSSGDMLVVRGSGTSVRIISINAASLASANGNLLDSAQSATKDDTSDSVNGIAFDAAGKGFLGNGTDVTQYNMPGWTGGSSKTAGLSDSTDLAGCSSPATIALYKNVNGERVRTTDQFKLNLNTVPAGMAETATTSGTETGIQDQKIGPLPTARGTVFTFNEEFVGNGNNAADYVSKWACTIDGQPLSNSDNQTGATGTSGTVTIPTSGDAVVCTITNAPLVANVTLHKEINTVANPAVWAAKPGWSVGVAVASSNNPTLTPNQPTQNTNAQGAASWEVRFANQTNSAEITVSEATDVPGYEFESGVCTVRDLNGTLTSTVDIADPAATPISGVKAGDRVDCTFRNSEVPVSIVVNKQWVVNGGTPIAHVDRDASLDAKLKLDGVETVWGTVLGSLSVGDSVRVSEESTIESDQCTLKSSTIAGPSLTGEVSIKDVPVDVELALGENAYMITNSLDCVQELTLTKVVDNTFDGDLLPVDWSLTPQDWDQKLIATIGTTEHKFDSGQTIEVSEGTFTLSELDQPGYQFVSLVCGDKTITDSTIEIGFAEAVDCTFTNKISPGSVSWDKVDATDTSILLGGSEWALTGPNNVAFAGNPIVDCVAATAADCVGPDKNHEAGKFSLTGLAWGEYSLAETKAPPGYSLNAEPHTFTIGVETGQTLDVELDAITNSPVTPPTIPLTGGIGRDFYALLGFGLLVLSAGAYGVMQQRSLRREV